MKYVLTKIRKDYTEDTYTISIDDNDIATVVSFISHGRMLDICAMFGHDEFIIKEDRHTKVLESLSDKFLGVKHFTCTHRSCAKDDMLYRSKKNPVISMSRGTSCYELYCIIPEDMRTTSFYLAKVCGKGRDILAQVDRPNLYKKGLTAYKGHCYDGNVVTLTALLLLIDRMQDPYNSGVIDYNSDCLFNTKDYQYPGALQGLLCD